MRPSMASAILTAALTGVVLSACTDQPTASGSWLSAPPRALSSADGASARVSVCHFSGAGARVITVAESSIRAHEGHGDYVTELVVDKPYLGITDGVRFGRIADAIMAAKVVRTSHRELESAACRITISVGPGVVTGAAAPNAPPGGETFPLVLDAPDVTLRGSFVMPLDGNGRAADVAGGPDATIISPSVPLPFVAGLSIPIFVVDGHPGGSAGNGVVIEGFVLRSGHPEVGTGAGGQGVLSLRVRDLVVRGNRFDWGFTESIDLRATSATVEVNHLSGGRGSCDMCLAGPGDYTARGNRLLGGGIPGIFIIPAVLLPVPPGIEQYALPATAALTASVVNNEVRDHLRLPVGVGLRVGAIGVGAPNVVGTTRVDARDNLLVNNRFGVIVEAAFPVVNTALRGDIDFTLHGNTIAASCQTNLLVAFTRHTTALGLASLPYLRNATYALSLGGDISWADAWYGHPAGFGNTLLVDGETIGNRVKHSYDAARTCTT